MFILFTQWQRFIRVRWDEQQRHRAARRGDPGLERDESDLPLDDCDMRELDIIISQVRNLTHVVRNL